MANGTRSAPAKTRFVIVDAVGVCENDKTDSRPLERLPSVPFDKLLLRISFGQRDEDTLISLANRLTRLNREMAAPKRGALVKSFRDFIEQNKDEITALQILYREEMRVSRERGLQRANVHGFHSFRTTWVTLALTAGVPLELVRRVTGHRTADIVLGNYFQPGREEFRTVLRGAMPKLLTGTDQSAELTPIDSLAIKRSKR